MIINKIIRSGVHKRLKELNKTQSWLAQKSGIKASEISDFFNGKKNFSEKRIVKLIAPLSVDLNEVIRNGLNGVYDPDTVTHKSEYERRIKQLEADNRKLIETVHTLTTVKQNK